MKGVKVDYRSAGFTGTQMGMTPKQEKVLLKILVNREVKFLHHGDCIGSDYQAHLIMQKLGLITVVHPPLNAAKRAYAPNPDKVLPEKEYLARNRDIVDATEVLIATPESRISANRSGTWATVRYAARIFRPIIIIFPDGVVEYREGQR